MYRSPEDFSGLTRAKTPLRFKKSKWKEKKRKRKIYSYLHLFLVFTSNYIFLYNHLCALNYGVFQPLWPIIKLFSCDVDQTRLYFFVKMTWHIFKLVFSKLKAHLVHNQSIKCLNSRRRKINIWDPHWSVIFQWSFGVVRSKGSLLWTLRSDGKGASRKNYKKWGFCLKSSPENLQRQTWQNASFQRNFHYWEFQPSPRRTSKSLIVNLPLIY